MRPAGNRPEKKKKKRKRVGQVMIGLQVISIQLWSGRYSPGPPSTVPLVSHQAPEEGGGTRSSASRLTYGDNTEASISTAISLSHMKSRDDA